LGYYPIQRTAILQPILGLDSSRYRRTIGTQGDEGEAQVSNDDFVLWLTPSEMEYLRTSLRNESERLRKQGFTGLQAYVDALRDKISNMLIEQAQSKFDKRVSV
jgi:hypothetical protein